MTAGRPHRAPHRGAEAADGNAADTNATAANAGEANPGEANPGGAGVRVGNDAPVRAPRHLVAVQSRHPEDPRRDVPKVLARACRAVEHGGVAVLPEYFYRPPGPMADVKDLAALAFVEDLVVDASGSCEGALVATVPEPADDGGVYNTALVVEGGRIVHRQRKLRPTPREVEAGVLAGDEIATCRVQGLDLGVLVCADVLVLELVARLAAMAPDVVAVPVLSPNRSRGAEEDPTQQARTSVFVARAWDLGAYVVKAGGHFEPYIVGRSLITAPWGIMARGPGDFQDTLLAAPFEPGRLAQVRGEFDGLRREPD